MLYNIRLQRISNVKCSSLMVHFVSYKEKEVLWILSLVPYSWDFIFLVTYEQVQ
jgi:hypothetical protein